MSGLEKMTGGCRPAGWLVLVTWLALGVSGCFPPSALEQNYGRAVAFNQSVMMVNPPSDQEQAPATGMSTMPAEATYESFTKGFVKKGEEKPARITLGVSGGAFGGGQ